MLFVVLTALFSVVTWLIFGHPESGVSLGLALLVAALTPNYRRKHDSA